MFGPSGPEVEELRELVPPMVKLGSRLAVLLRGNTDGTEVRRQDIGDELLGLIATGESVAAQLAWVFERISRQPQLLNELTAEVDAGGHTLRRATIREVLRIRSLSGYTGRYVYAPTFRLGEWTVPQGCVVRVTIGHLHRDPTVFADPERFDPHRYLDGNPSPFEWIPYGGGTRRCRLFRLDGGPGVTDLDRVGDRFGARAPVNWVFFTHPVQERREPC